MMMCREPVRKLHRNSILSILKFNPKHSLTSVAEIFSFNFLRIKERIVHDDNNFLPGFMG